MIKLRTDSRSKDFHFSEHFGNVVEFPTEFIVKDSIPDVIQAPGNSECVAISCCDLANDRDEIIYDYDDLYNRIPHSMFGSVPQDGFKETINGGLLIKGGVLPRVKDFSSFYSAHTGTMGAFDNVRSALLITNYPIIIYTNWFSNWTAGVMPIGENVVSNHCYVIEGWKVINGEPMFQIEAWLGHKMFMPASTFNDAISKLGCGTAVLSTAQIDTLRRRNLIEYIIDLCENTILLIKQLMNTSQPVPSTPPEAQNEPTEPVFTPPALNTLNNFCLAISAYEGGPGDLNHRNNNPGNCRGSSGKFLVFKTWDEGFAYLENYVKRVIAGTHPAYPKNPTIEKFFSIYAPTGDGNSPLIYAHNVATKCGLSINDTLSKLT